MSLVSAGSISLDSTFKHTQIIGTLLQYILHTYYRTLRKISGTYKYSRRYKKRNEKVSKRLLLMRAMWLMNIYVYM
jgi:hypothetical protein